MGYFTLALKPLTVRGKYACRKNGASADDLSGNNVIYFDTEAERDEHFRALEANVAQGLDRYAGFEEMYEGIDTSEPVTYMAK